MENYGKKKMWMKKLDSSGSMPTTFYGSDIQMMWLHDDSSNVMFSNIEMGERNYKKLEQSHRHLPMVFPFLSDCETWNFNPPPRSIKPKAVSKILRRNDRCKLEELNLTC